MKRHAQHLRAMAYSALGISTTASVAAGVYDVSPYPSFVAITINGLVAWYLLDDRHPVRRLRRLRRVSTAAIAMQVGYLRHANREEARRRMQQWATDWQRLPSPKVPPMPAPSLGSNRVADPRGRRARLLDALNDEYPRERGYLTGSMLRAGIVRLPEQPISDEEAAQLDSRPGRPGHRRDVVTDQIEQHFRRFGAQSVERKSNGRVAVRFTNGEIYTLNTSGAVETALQTMGNDAPAQAARGDWQ